MQDNKEEIPIPTSPDLIKIDSDSFLAIVEFDMALYKKETNSKAVKKTLTIPRWLDEEASSLGINFSQVLQEALIGKIQTRS